MLPGRGGRLQALLFAAEDEFLTELLVPPYLPNLDKYLQSFLLFHLIFPCISAEKDSDNYLNNMMLFVKDI